jgi:hypothetical protein
MFPAVGNRDRGSRLRVFEWQLRQNAGIPAFMPAFVTSPWSGMFQKIRDLDEGLSTSKAREANKVSGTASQRVKRNPNPGTCKRKTP